MSTKKVFLQYRLPAILWAGLIFIGSSIPGKSLPPLKIFSWDKLLHAGEFGIFSFLLARAYKSWLGSTRVKLLGAYTIVTGVVWAMSDEIHQMFVPFRDASVYDFLADSLGVVIALVIFTWVQRRHLPPG